MIENRPHRHPHSTTRPPFLAVVLPMLAALLVAGCSSLSPSAATSATATAKTPSAPEIDSDNPVRLLKKGLTGAQVTALLGAPAAVKPQKAEGVAAEIWTYTRSTRAGARQVSTGTRDVPYVDPITGVMRNLQEPIFEMQATYVIETTELLMLSGVLAEWKQQVRVDRQFQ